jgi:hypothetical protein
MERVGFSPKAVGRVASCSTSVFLFRHVTRNVYRHRVNCCNHRLCAVCLRNRVKMKVVDTLRAIPAATRRHRFVTLTQRSLASESLRESIRRLKKSFRALRAKSVWANAVLGGVSILEATHKPGRGWHAHFHCIVDADWIDEDALSREWLVATGDSYVVRVRDVRDPKDLSTYLAAYLAKGLPDELERSSASLDDLCDGLRGTNFVRWLGAWKGAAVQAKAADETRQRRRQLEPYSPADWVFVGELNTLILRAQNGCDRSQEILDECGFGPVQATLLSGVGPMSAARSPPTRRAAHEYFRWSVAG